MMIPPHAHTIIVRHSELGCKSSQVQARLEQRLQANIQARLSRNQIASEIDREPGRLFVRVDKNQLITSTELLQTCPGISSLSPATNVRATLPAICSRLRDIAHLIDFEETFAVRARRAGPPEAHPFSSVDIEVEGGAAINTAMAQASVDLDNPDLTFFVEARANRAFIFLDKHEGPGGFPIGSQGRVVCLISGGIDSPVAAWEMMCRGCEIVPVYIDFGTYGGQDHIARAMASIRRLASYTPAGKLTVYQVPAGTVAKQLCKTVNATRMLSLRRFMFAIAEQIANAEAAHAIVTGESIGQKSSQTGPNLGVTDQHIACPVHRPLLARDKQSIIEQAKQIGTFEESTIDAGCNRIAPSYPETNATIVQVREAEPSEFLTRVDEAVENMKSQTIVAPVEGADQDQDPTRTTSVH